MTSQPSLARSSLSCLILAAGLVRAAAAGDAGNCFPGGGTSESPGRRHAVVYRWEHNVHRLYLRTTGGRAPQRLLDFERSACVLWSPSGAYFAITDYAGSNVSAVEIVSSEKPSARTDVSELLPARVRELMASSLHGYLEAVSWDGSGLTVRAWGDRELEPQSFDVWLRCTRDGARWTCAAAEGSG